MSVPRSTARRRAPVVAGRANVRDVLASLERLGTKRTRDGFARYGIRVTKAFGVTMADIQKLAKRLGRDADLAQALWDSGWYEARLLAAFVDEPERVAPAKMDRWARDFDNWGICDTVCFHLFDRSPHAFRKVEAWAKKDSEFVKRAAFALLACLALHDESAPEDRFHRCLPLVERAAGDERNFVKKGVSWALRSVARRSEGLLAASMAVARRLAESSNAASRWVGKDALRDLSRPAVARRLASRRRTAAERD